MLDKAFSLYNTGNLLYFSVLITAYCDHYPVSAINQNNQSVNFAISDDQNIALVGT